MRSNLFPKQQARAVESLKNALVREASRSVMQVEALYHTTCPNPRLESVEVVQQDANSVLSRISKFLYPGCAVIGSERWKVNRCGVSQDYVINYYRATEEDQYFARVFPTNFRAARDMTIIKVKDWFS
eukprot:TRINITY_DN6408_c0_g1_i2.p1 TRINITY_DN6408_c0_g1~~TRINITY_DN6408_c0_g1_i2.p1  ORF type:complete len:128 (+),score=10.61 TRINITY_DN6408_c0_g1_i2:60-443(+)